MTNLFENEIEREVQKRLSEIVKDPLKIIEAYEIALKDASKKIEIYKPKAELYDITMGSDSLFEMSSVAKNVNFRNMGSKNLFSYLRSKEILRHNNEPYQRFVDMELFKTIKQPYKRNNKDYINIKTMTTQKGIEYITKLLLGDGYECNDR